MRNASPRLGKILSVDVQRRTAEIRPRGSHLGSLSMNAVACLWVALVVNCQGLGKVLPDMSALNNPEKNYKAIVLDELSPAQVISNKAFFQAGNDFVALSQSVCNQHAYQIWPYGMALIGCSNDFPMTVAEGLEQADEDNAEAYREVLNARKCVRAFP